LERERDAGTVCILLDRHLAGVIGLPCGEIPGSPKRVFEEKRSAGHGRTAPYDHGVIDSVSGGPNMGGAVAWLRAVVVDAGDPKGTRR
jgi:hypothetical protein